MSRGVHGCNKGWVMDGESGDMHVKESGGFREKRGRMAGLEVAMNSKEDAYPIPVLWCDGPQGENRDC